MALAIEARGLEKTYRGDVRALRGLDLAVEAGQVYGLLGPNGAGKSTAVRILTTLARPDAGTATVAGADVLADPDRVRRAIGVVAQRSGVDIDATGRENLVLHARLHGLSDGPARAAELLGRFDLADAGDRLVKTWSGGMARRLDPSVFYVACRWDYDVTPKEMLRGPQMAMVTNADTGVMRLAHVADWGPHEEQTGRAADLSPALEAEAGPSARNQRGVPVHLLVA